MVGAANLRQPVRDQQGGATLENAPHRALDLVFGVAIDRAGAVVEHQNARVAQKRARNRDALALPARKHYTALANHGCIAIGETHDELMCLRLARGRFDLLLRHRLARAKRNVLGNRAREQEDILLDRRDLRAQAVHTPFAHVNAVDQHAARAGVEGAVDQARQRRLARAGLPDNRDRLAGMRGEADVLQRRRRTTDAGRRAISGRFFIRQVLSGRWSVVVVAEAHIFKHQLTDNWLRHAAGIFVQLGFGQDHRQDAARAGQALLHHRGCHQQEHNWRAQRADQRHVGDDLADRELAAAEQQQRVPKRQADGDAIEQQRQVARGHFAFAHKGIAVRAGILLEALILGALLRKALHHFDAGDRFGQAGIERAKALAQLPGHRAQLVVVAAQRHRQRDQEDHRHQQEVEFQDRDRHQRHDQRQRRLGCHAERGADELVDLLHVVGDARHQVADALAAVEGLAFAEQAEVQLVAGVALDALRQHANCHAVDDVEQAVADKRGHHPQRSARQLGRAAVVHHGIEGPAHRHSRHALRRGHAHGGEEKHHRQHRVAHNMRGDPAQRRAPVVLIFVGNGKFAAGHAGSSLWAKNIGAFLRSTWRRRVL